MSNGLKYVHTAIPLPFPLSLRHIYRRPISQQGLRGITALFIVTYHIFSSLDDSLLSPSRNSFSNPSFFQLPIIRLPISGRASLSCFFILTGFVNSLSYHRHIRAGDTQTALLGLSKSSLRRIGRIIVPSTGATVVSWAICQFGFYRLAQQGDVAWFRNISPDPSSSFHGAVADLIKSCWKTWTDGGNVYDRVQWNLGLLLKASLYTYLVLLMTASLEKRWRRVVVGGWFVYGWGTNDGMFLPALAPAPTMGASIH